MKSWGNLEKRWQENSRKNIHIIWRQTLSLWKICNKNKKASTKGTPSVKYSLVFPTPPVLNIRYVSAQPRRVTGMFPPPLHDAIAIRMVGCRHSNTVMLPFVCWMKWPIVRSDRGIHTGYDWAVAAPIVLATGRSGGWQQEVMAALCVREQWRLGPNPNVFCFSGLVHRAKLCWDLHPHC